MVQVFLDPSETSTNGSWKPLGPIPKTVRDFGKFPNIDQWQPGDLILVSAIEPNFISRRIIRAQENGGFSSEDARWHHAAVYIGEARICEATGTGVKVNLLYPYIGSHLIRVRRDQRLTPSDGWRIAINALFRLREKYSFWTILKIAFQARRGFWNESVWPNFSSSRAIICSKLYADAYTFTTMRTLQNAAGETPIPAFLSNTTLLQDVDIAWYSIGE